MVRAGRRDFQAGALTDAERETVDRNRGLVYALAKRMELGRRLSDDAIQAGFLGLMRAARKYDPAKGVAFSTYAAYWIRQGIGRHFENNHMVHVPVHVQRNTRPEPAAKWGRMLREEMGARAAAAMVRPESIQATGREPAAPDPAREVERDDVIARVRAAVSALPPREAEVVRRRMDGETIKAIGEAMGLTPDGAKRVGRKAHARLREMLAGCDD